MNLSVIKKLSSPAVAVCAALFSTAAEADQRGSLVDGAVDYRIANGRLIFEAPVMNITPGNRRCDFRVTQPREGYFRFEELPERRQTHTTTFFQQDADPTERSGRCCESEFTADDEKELIWKFNMALQEYGHTARTYSLIENPSCPVNRPTSDDNDGGGKTESGLSDGDVGGGTTELNYKDPEPLRNLMRGNLGYDIY